MLTVSEVLAPETWRELDTALAIEAALPEELGDLLREGYLNVPGVIPAEVTARLAAGVRALVERDIPPVFLWMTEAPWRLFRAFDPLLARVLGADFRLLPEIWTWFVPPSDDAAGWQPHRDQSKGVLVAEDGSPHSLTLWVPLSDATVLNGCMYLVPMHLDPDFRRPGPPYLVRRPQDVRALPATAGSLLAWNGNVLHWGARSSRRAEGPRISIACQFQRARDPVLGRPLLAPGVIPRFELRAFLVARAILGYGQAVLSDDLRRLAEELRALLYERIANG